MRKMHTFSSNKLIVNKKKIIKNYLNYTLTNLKYVSAHI